jgi:hypothetical protein
MLRLTGNVGRSAERRGELLQVTEQRLIRYGCTEREAHALARITTLERTSTDSEVEAAVIGALVQARVAVSGRATVKYVAGRRCNVQRKLEGRR